MATDPDALAQFLENARSCHTTCSSFTVPGGIVTITVEFEPWAEESDDDD